MNWRRANKEKRIFTKQTLTVPIVCQHCSVLSMALVFDRVFEGDDGAPISHKCICDAVATDCLCVHYQIAWEPWCECSRNSIYTKEFFFLL